MKLDTAGIGKEDTSIAKVSSNWQRPSGFCNKNSHVFFSDVKDERVYYNFQLLLVQAISQTHFSQEKDPNMCQTISYKASHVACTYIHVYQKYNIRLSDRR